tara:strand:- start:300 stop:881 length:582 start_codon:yes stop_codon:yes gene_type:complete
MSEMFLQNLARGLGSFFNNAAPAYAMSGMTTPYGRSSPGINVNARGSGNPFNATNAGSMLGMSAPRATLDSFANRHSYGHFSDPSPTRHLGYSGYDITQQLMGEDPEFMSRIHFGQLADKQAGGGNTNTLAAMQYIMDRNKAREAERFAKYGNPEPGSKFANPNLRNQQPTYVDRQDYNQPQMTDVDIFGSLF